MSGSGAAGLAVVAGYMGTTFWCCTPLLRQQASSSNQPGMQLVSTPIVLSIGLRCRRRRLGRRDGRGSGGSPSELIIIASR